jgi:hypothetical protein
VAVANGLVVAVTVFRNQPGKYPGKFLAVQIAIVIAALILAAKNHWLRGLGFFLLLAIIVLSFSAMLLYIPTFVAAVWFLVSSATHRA